MMRDNRDRRFYGIDAYPTRDANCISEEAMCERFDQITKLNKIIVRFV